MDTLQECVDKMDKTIISLKESLQTLRAGRVSAALLDKVSVSYYGENTPLKHLASISVVSATDIQIKPFDPSIQKDVLGGINKADLGANAVVNGGAIILKFPAPSEDRRQELIKQAKKYGEDGKVAIRNIRKDFNNKAKKDDTLSEDMQHDFLDNIQTATDKHIAEIDKVLVNKINDIETI
ncbi:MAG: ribosome recycling factor [Bacilli bacterium]